MSTSEISLKVSKVKSWLSNQTNDYESTRTAIQTLIETMYNTVTQTKQSDTINPDTSQEIIGGLMCLIEICTHPVYSVLIDGPLLFPLLVHLMQEPWLSHGISQVNFAVIYNLCQLNGNRYKDFYAAGGIKALVEYLKQVQTIADQENRKKQTNLCLSQLYIAGSLRNPNQQEFITVGALQEILDLIDDYPSVLVFISQFIGDTTPAEAVPAIVYHPYFANSISQLTEDEDILEENTKERARIKFIAETLRKLSSIQGSAPHILYILSKFLPQPLEIADEAIHALANLASKNSDSIDWNYVWESSLLGYVLSRACDITEKFFINAQNDPAAPVNTNGYDGRLILVNHVYHILKQKQCFEAAAGGDTFVRQINHEDDIEDIQDIDSEDDESDQEVSDSGSDHDVVMTESDASQLLKLLKMNSDIISKFPSYAHSLSKYLNIFSSSKTIWEDFSDTVSWSANSVTEKRPDIYMDNSISFDKLIPMDTKQLSERLPPVMWRPYSSVFPKSTSTVTSGNIFIAPGELSSIPLASILTLIVNANSSFFKITWPQTLSDRILLSFSNSSIEIDSYLPCYAMGGPMGLTSQSSQLIWVPLLEKHLAIKSGSYSSLQSLNIKSILKLLEIETVEITAKLSDVILTLAEKRSENRYILATSSLSENSLCLIVSFNDSKVQFLDTKNSELSSEMQIDEFTKIYDSGFEISL